MATGFGWVFDIRAGGCGGGLISSISSNLMLFLTTRPERDVVVGVSDSILCFADQRWRRKGGNKLINTRKQCKPCSPVR